MHAPARSLKRLLVEVGVRPTTFGRLRGIAPFLGSQARLRLSRTFPA